MFFGERNGCRERKKSFNNRNFQSNLLPQNARKDSHIKQLGALA
jgi:hypothetical protein